METIIGKWAWEMEDYLQSFESKSGRPVFCSMFDEFKNCHSDSYGTCLNYTEFFEAFDSAPYTKEQWLNSVQYWLDGECVGVPLKLIALYLQRPDTKFPVE